MVKALKLIIALAAIAVYLLALRYVAPSDEPYFILGIGVVGLVAWLLGRVSGLIAALLLIPLTTMVYQQFEVSTSYLTFASSPAYLGIQIVTAITLGYLRREKMVLSQKETELAYANERLQTVLSQVQELGGMHNLCSKCKAIQDDEGMWQAVDHYLKNQTKMQFSHCMCPDCAASYKQELLSKTSD